MKLPVRHAGLFRLWGPASRDSRRRTAFLLAAVAAILPGQAAARPWCDAGGLSSTERAICESAILRELDAALAEAYGQDRASPTDATQNAWLAERNGCGSDLRCIERTYRMRIAALGDANGDHCSDMELNATERTICGDPELTSLHSAMILFYEQARPFIADDRQEIWMRAERDACGSDKHCIAAAYARRANVLRRQLSDLIDPAAR